MKGLFTALLLIVSNSFMIMAWYGHLKFEEWGWFKKSGLWAIVLISWGLAFFEYCFQVPANRIGFKENGGPFSLLQLKVLQEVITLVVFVLFAQIFFKSEPLKITHLISLGFLILAVFFAFK